jgi:hypothetical protein
MKIRPGNKAPLSGVSRHTGKGSWTGVEPPVDKMWIGSHESNQPTHNNYRL